MDFYDELIISAPDDSLREQYWQIMPGERIFEYIVGSDPIKHSDYDEIILDWETGWVTHTKHHIAMNKLALCNINFSRISLTIE